MIYIYILSGCKECSGRYFSDSCADVFFTISSPISSRFLLRSFSVFLSVFFPIATPFSYPFFLRSLDRRIPPPLPGAIFNDFYTFFKRSLQLWCPAILWRHWRPFLLPISVRFLTVFSPISSSDFYPIFERSFSDSKSKNL